MRGMCIAITVRLFCCVVFAAGAGAEMASAQTGAVNGGTIRVAANYHPGGSNPSEQEAIASTHDLIVLGTGWGDTGPPARYYTVNPEIIAIEYQSWYDTGPGGVDYDYISENHEDWFYHDADGYRIATYRTAARSDCDPVRCPSDPAFCHCRFGLNLGHPGLRTHVAERFLDLVTTGGAWGSQRGFDGIFMDNTFPSWPYRDSKVNNGTVSGKPVYEDGTVQTEALWVEDQRGFIEAMKDAVGPSKTIIYNGCLVSANFPSWKNNSYLYLEHADGCTMENWVVEGKDLAATPKTGSAWKRDVDLFAGVNDRDKWSTPLIGSGVHSAGVNRYGIASALLVWTGPHSAMNFWKGTALEAIAGRFEETFPEAFVDLGTPAEPYVTLPSGVASRDFTGGRVLVNSTTATHTVSLTEPMRTIEGALVSEVTLASGRAEILLAEGGSQGEPPADVENLHRTDVKN